MPSGWSFSIIKVFHYLSIAKLSQSQRRHSYQSLHWGRSLHWQGPAEETQLPNSTLRTQTSLARFSWGDTVIKTLHWGRSAHLQGRLGDTVTKSSIGQIWLRNTDLYFKTEDRKPNKQTLHQAEFEQNLAYIFCRINQFQLTIISPAISKQSTNKTRPVIRHLINNLVLRN